MKAELDELADEPSELVGEAVPEAPVAPVAPDLPAVPDVLLLPELALEEAFVVPAADTVCPTSPDSDTIVPLSGA